MPVSSRPPCQICSQNVSKYTCSTCMIVYCSVSCYKRHKESSCTSAPPGPTTVHQPGSQRVGSSPPRERPPALAGHMSDAEHEGLIESKDLRPLTSLKWPYVPDESAYPDPLKRDDPKPLQLYQYEAIATSPAIRKALASHASLPALLKSIDDLRGPDRETAIHQALGVTPSSLSQQATHMDHATPEEDVLALRELAAAVEAAVRAGKDDALGLDWELHESN